MIKNLPETPDDREPLTRTQVLVAMGVTAVVLSLIARVWMQAGAIALFPIQWSITAIFWGLALGGLITGASSIVYRVWGTYRQNADYYLKLVLKPLTWTDLIWLGLLPGMSEELLFRGVMLPAFGFDLLAVFLSSLCFGVLHLSNLRQWAYVVWATIVGGILGVCTLATGNLLVPIVAHVSTNLISSCLWKWGEQQNKQPEG